MRIKHGDLEGLLHMIRLGEHLIGTRRLKAFNEEMLRTPGTALEDVLAKYQAHLGIHLNRMEAPTLANIIAWGIDHDSDSVDEITTKEGAKYAIAYSGLHFIQCTSIYMVHRADFPCVRGGLELLCRVATVVFVAFLYDLARQDFYLQELRERFTLKTKVEPVGRYSKKK